VNATNLRRLRRWQQKWRLQFGEFPNIAAHHRQLGQGLLWPVTDAPRLFITHRKVLP